jgi:DNA repair protein RadC
MNKQNLCKEDQIDYKIVNGGTRSVTDSELISIIIGEAIPDKSRKLLHSTDNNLLDFGKLGYFNFREAGVTHKKAVCLLASIELGRRRKLTAPADPFRIKCSEDAFNIFQPLIGDLSHEEFWVLFLNRGSRIIGKTRLSSGGISGTVTDVRVLLKKAIESVASGIIVCHNHPSGNLVPSESDTKITRKIKEAGDLLDIQLLDHVIITDKLYYSFADNGLI